MRQSLLPRDRSSAGQQGAGGCWDRPCQLGVEMGPGVGIADSAGDEEGYVGLQAAIWEGKSNYAGRSWD